MHTDISLRVLTMERGHDLFKLLGIPENTTLLGVDSLDLPAVSKRLDNILHLVTPDGRQHKHLVEWHGWYDPTVLWRVTGYVCWHGQKHPDDPLTITLVYLTPECDMGNTITQMIGEKVMFTCTVHVVRLWKFPSVDALATGLPGMAVLSPLMQGATVETITHAVTIIRHTTSKPQQNNLLAILGAFSVPLVESTEQLIHLIGKEPIVDSELFTTLFEERYGEEMLRYREQLAAKDEELYHKDEELHHKDEELYHKDEELQEFINGLQYTLVQTLVARFPQASDGLQHQIRQVATTTHLTALFHTVATAQSLSDIEAAILRMRERSQN